MRQRKTSRKDLPASLREALRAGLCVRFFFVSDRAFACA
jgi:hypothetical protein